MMQNTPFGRTRFCCALNSLEEYRNSMLCSECVGMLQPGEVRTLWPEKCVGNLRWRVYDFSGAWDACVPWMCVKRQMALILAGKSLCLSVCPSSKKVLRS